MSEGVCVLTAEQAGIAATALAMLAMRVGGESPGAAAALKALRTQTTDARAEAKRLRGLLTEARAFLVARVNVNGLGECEFARDGARPLLDRIDATLGEVPRRV